jgi:hypothetical protein
MDYKNKYLKYKQKYIDLKNQSNFVQSDSYKQKYIALKGGQGCKNLKDVLQPILESNDPKCKKIENVKNINYSEVCNIPVAKLDSIPIVKSASEISLPSRINKRPSNSSSQKVKTSSVSASKIKSNKNIDIELYNIVTKTGGRSKNIWPLITKTWNKYNQKLGIRDRETKNTFNFSIEYTKIPPNIDAPIFGKGSFTAVYKLKNLIDPSDNTEYLLRIYERENMDIHILNSEKIIKEREIYNDYSYQIYYFGELKISDKEFSYLQDEFEKDTDQYIFSDTNKDYMFDYIITRKYNVPLFDALDNITNIDNPKKFLFLYNNIVMLHKMFLNREFHADFKIANIGWNNNDLMDVILIDYDGQTIQKAIKDNTNFEIYYADVVQNFYFPYTYIPEYLKGGEFLKIKHTPYELFNMYSVGGLIQVINSLRIKYSIPIIDLPPELQTKNIVSINTSNIGSSLNLDSTNYALIPSYENMLKILDFIKTYVKVSVD